MISNNGIDFTSFVFTSLQLKEILYSVSATSRVTSLILTLILPHPSLIFLSVTCSSLVHSLSVPKLYENSAHTILISQRDKQRSKQNPPLKVAGIITIWTRAWDGKRKEDG